MTTPRIATTAYHLLLGCLFILLFLTSHTIAFAQPNGPAFNPGQSLPDNYLDAVGSGELFLKADSGNRYSALLQSTKVDITVEGMIARVVVIQEFVNQSPDWVEGEYVFPLPTDSAVDYMAMIIGERRIVGKIHEKQQAKKIYDAAKRAGKKASLVEQHRPNLFRNRVANISPGETIEVELRYVETLTYDQGRFSLRFPTTLTPRYIPGSSLQHLTLQSGFSTSPMDAVFGTANPNVFDVAVDHNFDVSVDRNSGWALPTAQVPDAHLITPPMTTSAQAAHLQLNATIDAGLPLTEVKSVYHPAQVSESSHIYSIQLDSNLARLNNDVLLEWTPVTGRAPAAALFHEISTGVALGNTENTLGGNTEENFFLLMLLPPQDISGNVLPKETVFIIDTSGSMAGNSIVQAQQALLKGLSYLKTNDRFNIIEFDSNARALWHDAQFVDGNSLFQAEQFVTGLVADGGTEMMSALNMALTRQAPEGYVRQVVFITDGSVGNENELFNLIESKRRNSRIFTVGIGSAPNSFFMQSAAKAGQGSYTYIGALDDIQQKMSDLFFKLENPVMTNINVDFGNSDIEVFPQSIPDLYAGEPLVVTVNAKASLPQSVQISGQRNQVPFQQSLELNSAKPANDISKLWARKKIEGLSETLRRSPSTEIQAIEASITQVALQHQLLSKFTSFVAVEEIISRPNTEALLTRAVPNAMPEGNTMLASAMQNNAAQPVAFGRTALGLMQLWLVAIIAFTALLLLHHKTLLARRRPV